MLEKKPKQNLKGRNIFLDSEKKKTERNDRCFRAWKR